MKRFIYLLSILLISSNCTLAFSLPKAKEAPKFVQSEQYQNISNQANIFYAENDIKSAFNLFLSIPENERSAQNWLLLGNILQDQGKIDEATFMYNKAIELDNKYYKAYYNLGNIYLQDGRPNMAIEQYKKVIKLKPEYPYAHYNLGCAYIKLGKYGKAKFELLTAIDLKNTVPDFHYNLAYVYKQLNKEKSAKTYIEYYNKLIQEQM
jgi:tetratricopeptide (TPR) repeat protein|uniref:tetratricopeptide repeat protein n=1 Tax=Candidatus Stercorousia sp. TaxID=3048886 RepID=UPI0040295D92